MLGTLVKDNTGYDMKQLFIGKFVKRYDIRVLTNLYTIVLDYLFMIVSSH